MEIDTYSIKDHTNKNQLFLNVVLNSGEATIYKDTYCITHLGNRATLNRREKPTQTWDPKREWRNIFADEMDKILVDGFIIQKNKTLMNFLKRISELVMEFIGFSREHIIKRIQERIEEDEYVNLEILRDRIFIP